MKRILFVMMITIGSAFFLMPLPGAGQDEPDPDRADHGNLYARFFLDPQQYPNQVQPSLEELDSGGGIPIREPGEQKAPVVEPEKKTQTYQEYVKFRTLKPLNEMLEVGAKIEKKKEEKTEIAEKEKKPSGGEKRRGVFNLNLMAGSSFAYYRTKRLVTADNFSGMYSPVSETRESLGIAPGLNVHFIFNVAKYFALGFGADANYFYVHKLSSKYSSPLASFDMIYHNLSPSNPGFYLEVPVYGLMRFYFSEKFRTAYLVLGGGVDFFLLGRPFARSIIARGGIGFTLDNGFTMEFAYQYNTDLAQDSSLTNIKDMHRGMVSMGYCFNVGGK
jgi:hypothetical protein